ncbi:hypothetical protein H0H87_008432 [Tephrocybe sp. NHM501043]|nr:hypothetical protein H0H87_008432 [Tephrocybe sp. NHM501043]
MSIRWSFNQENARHHLLSVIKGARDNTVRIWTMPTAPAATNDDPATPFSSFSSDGTLVLSASADRILRRWNSFTATSHRLPEFRGKIRKAAHVAFSPDGSRMTAVSSEMSIYLWDTTTCDLMSSSVTDFISEVNSIAFTRDSQRLVTTYSTVPSQVLWEVSDGKLRSIDKDSIPEALTNYFFDVAEPYLDMRCARWYSTKMGDSGVWAFVRDHVVRGRKDGSITVVPVNAEKHSARCVLIHST